MTARPFPMSRRIDEPRPGYFTVRLVAGGPAAPAVIFLPCPMMPAALDFDPIEWCTPLDRSRRLEALIDGEPAANPARVVDIARMPAVRPPL